MRIIELSTFGETCGIATYAEALVEALRDRGATVEVLAPKLRRGVVARGPQPERIWNVHKATLADALRTYWTVQKAGADVVHIQHNVDLYSPRFLSTLVRFCRLAEIPVVVTLHGRTGGPRDRRRLFARTYQALGRAEIIVHNPQHAAELSRDNVHVIEHGIGAPSSITAQDARRAMGISPERKVLAHFGFIHPDKGIEAALRAFARVRQDGHPELFYAVLGGVFAVRESRDHLADLQSVAQRLGIAEHTYIPGVFMPPDQLTTALRAADWLLLNYQTGQDQGTSGAVRVSLASGRPVAVTGARLFDDVRDAVWTMEGPVDAAMKRMVTDSALTESVSQMAAAYRARHAWPVVAERHWELFASLCRTR